jgi:hypothetical protein
LVANRRRSPGLFGKQPMTEFRDVHGVNDFWDQGEWDYGYTSLT